MNITINLGESNRKPRNIEKKWAVEIKRQLYEGKEIGCLGIGLRPIVKFLRRHQHIEKTVLIDVQNLCIDPALVCKENEIIQLMVPADDSDGGIKMYLQEDLPMPLKLKGMNEPFSLFFDEGAVTDCKETQITPQRSYAISFEMVMLDIKTKEEFFKKKVELDIRFMAETNKPIVTIDTLDTLQFTSKEPTLHKIGKYTVTLPNKLKAAPLVDLDIELKAYRQSDGKVVEGLLVVTDDKGKKLPDPMKVRQLHMSTDDSGKPISTFTSTLFFDFSKIPNPLNDYEDYVIEPAVPVRYRYRTNDLNSEPHDPTMRPLHVDKKTVRILKDKQGTELVVSVSRMWPAAGEEGVVERPIAQQLKSGSSIEVPKVVFTSKSLNLPIKITLSNKATDTTRIGAGLTISNLKTSTMPANDPTISVRNRQCDSVDFNKIVCIQNAHSDIVKADGVFIPNGEGRHTDFQLTFLPASIFQIYCQGKRCYMLDLATKLEFDYIEDATGQGCEPKHFQTTIGWHLAQDPNPEWLAVDYGSSAIVCYFGCGEQSNVIDLRLARTSTYQKAKKKTKDSLGFAVSDITDKTESNTPFLPSDVLLNDVESSNEYSSLCSQISGIKTPQYNMMSVLLSPTSQLIVKNFRRQLPCLKVLMGNEYLPANEHYENYSYNRRNSAGKVERVTAISCKDEEISLLRIDSIFNEAYHTLFRYFITDGSIAEQVNQVVLTYPNTYTPRNLRTLRNIVEKVLPNVRRVETVSESDAVAAYYMSHWNEYHSLAEVNDIKNDENILVYDMGAGTLDVTYLTKRYNNSTETYTVEICGKIGTGRAGNYLDYVIAQILGEVLGDGFNPQWIGTGTKGLEKEELEARVQLKTAIKDIVKPALTDDNRNIEFTVAGHTFCVAANEVTEHSLFKTFIEECTTNIINRLKKYVGADNFRIDTVIMSGRSLRLAALQQSLRNIFDESYCIMLDNVVSGPEAGSKNNRSKTAVVEGAKTYVEVFLNPNSSVKIKSRRLLASYGVAYRRTGGQWEYCELLNHSNIPFADECVESFTRTGGSLTINGTNESATLRFIQTYLSETDTRDALNHNDLEFISEMEEVMMSALGYAKTLTVDAFVDRDNNVSLMVNGQITVGKTPRGIDLNDTITRQSLWPISIEG